MSMMLNFGFRANQILAGLWITSWAVFMIAGAVLSYGGTDVSKLFDYSVIVLSGAAMALFGGLLLVVVAIQDCLAGETSYTGKGRLLKSDGMQQTFELLTKTAFRNESPWTFWLVLFAKAAAGSVLLLPFIIGIIVQFR